MFRQAYNRLVAHAPTLADRRYIELLALAARTEETHVAAALGTLLRAGEAPLASVVEAQIQSQPPAADALVAFVPELRSYDALVQEVAA